MWFFAIDIKIFAWALLPTDMLDRGQAPCYDAASVCMFAMDVKTFVWGALPTDMLDRDQAPCYVVVSVRCGHRCQNLCLHSFAN